MKDEVSLIQTSGRPVNCSHFICTFFPGEMQDIFVGLMGRRNTESGECQIKTAFITEQ